MGKGIITAKQGSSMIVLFIMGSTLVTGTGAEAKPDIWIAILLGILFALPLIWIYSRILYLFPGKDLFEILENLFGTIIGKIFTIILTWYALHLGALVMRNFSEFINVAALPQTPAIVPLMCLSLLCIWGVKAGLEVLGRWAEFVLPLLVFIIVSVVFLSMPLADINNLRPVLHNNLKQVMGGAFSIFSFPFAETVLFLMVGLKFSVTKDLFKVYISSLFIGGVIVLIVGLRNMLVMGPNFMSSTYFPSYVSVSIINIGDFLQRMEILVSVVFLFSGFIKISVCLLAVSKGIASLFNIEKYQQITAPIGLLMIALSIILYSNTMEMIDWAFKVYRYYAFPFEVIIPVIIWTFAEIKFKKNQTVNTTG